MILSQILNQTLSHLSPSFYEEHKKLFSLEHLETIANFLENFEKNGLSKLPPPFLAKEKTPSLEKTLVFFEKPLRIWKKGRVNQNLERSFAKAFEKAGSFHLLLLLGQRRTKGTLVDQKGIPPLKAELMESATSEFKEGMTVVGRAWTKHAPRSKEDFWGIPKGSVEEKNEDALWVLEKIMERKTWWNMFGHFQHDRVYEARIASGHGARWTGDGKVFIGFLDPFEPEKKPENLKD